MHDWVLICYWCKFALLVGAGRGLAAANIMEEHVVKAHSKTWREYILLTSQESNGNT